MSEDLIIKYCAPTLAGIKTANLFSQPYTSIQEISEFILSLNKIMIPKGVKVMPLKFSKDRVLIYIFRPARLTCDLYDDVAKKLLVNLGYRMSDINDCIRELKRRVRKSPEFPHEIGLFLGYPPEDVCAFIVNKGSCCKFTGCWKVYVNEDEAVRQFKKFRKCSDVYYSKWLQGTSLQKLTVAL